MINVFLCEDEEMQLEYFKYQISQYIKESQKDARLVSARRDPEDTYSDAMKLGSQPSLFIIDIELPGFSMDGFQLVQKLEESQYPYWYVFLTAKSELAYKVFDYQLKIVDYLVKKPGFFLEHEMDREAIKRLDRIFDCVVQESNKDPKKILIIEKTKKMELVIDDIIFIQTVKGKHMVEVYTTEKSFMLRKTMREMTDLLGSQFISISKFCLVSRKHMKEIDVTKRLVRTTNNYECEISRRRTQEVFDIYEEEMEKC